MSEPNFDRVARIYRWSEYLALGPLLERVRWHFLPEMDDRRKALVLGDGDGRFVARLLGRNPGLAAHAVDTSAGMLRLLRRRCGFAGERLTTQQASLMAVVPAAGTDLVATHFVLDCLTQGQVEELARRMAEGTRTGTVWAVSDFGRPRLWALRAPAAVYVRALYFAFRVLTGLRVTRLPEPGAALEAAGFQRRARQEWLTGFLYTELWVRGYNQRRDGIEESMSERPQMAHDAQPDPEPAAPSLSGPDPGVFQHDVSPEKDATPATPWPKEPHA
jgi:ubiquinone/menaquinone biosynthesis C-methylase UbiE